MKRPGAILLISCYELGHQPMGIASPLGFLERAGYSPDVLDISLDPPDSQKLARARLAAVSVPMHTALRLGVRIAQRIRELNPSCHICFYGHYAVLNADYLLEKVADSILGGEFEGALADLARTLGFAGEKPLPVVRPEAGAARTVLSRLSFALPSRRALPPLSRYAALEMGDSRRVAGYVEASRGCLHFCRHCPIPPVYGGRFFVVPREIVLEDIRQQIREGATHVSFGDPDFLNGPGHSLGILRAAHREFPALTFDFTAKIEHLRKHQGLLPEFAVLGCLFIVSAVESLSERVLGILEKGHRPEDVLQVLEAVRRVGITLRPSLVPFTPWTTLADYATLLDFVEAQDLIEAVDPVQYTVRLLVPPGSRLLEHSEMLPHLGPLVRESFSYSWRHPDPRMEVLQRDVSATAEGAAHDQEDPRVTFRRIRSRYRFVAGQEECGPNLPPLPAVIRTLPRLTESWFC